ncbi:Recombination protein recR [Caldithrix abyssi DSM 13497]|uniref:Recombination protein RecR n=1 Tax=Caldithrix abyssi DSM 13497 TaxID=880073 RepID=H1XR06_CALAY|nr:recombination mediator RecR [Caldithrix abyssi]APF20021.1 recR DNA replication and repair protein RecR [Caldithrix abyssi DSM 13497]EHO40100.1 Recombination protein recR [Caldithrix abyssi DSM 13497]
MRELGISVLDELIGQLARLPGIGQKTAQRLAIFILKSSDGYAQELAQAILNVKQKTRLCKRCFNVAEDELCAICSDPRRDTHKICVVEDIVDVLAIEETHTYRGLYHVLGGVISPLAGVNPEDLNIRSLIERVKNEPIEEVILALNPSTEAETTIIYITKLLKDMEVQISRLASGVPMGAHLEYLDGATIGMAIQSRQKISKDT